MAVSEGKGKRLPTVSSDTPESLGAETIMDRALAARHGVSYVRLAVLSIDVDRVRELVDEIEDVAGDQELPFGWEVFLTELYLVEHVDPRPEAHGPMIEDTCLGILELGREGSPFGSQLPFAVYDAVRRGVWPVELGRLFRTWKGRADSMVRKLEPLWQQHDEWAAELAAVCLEAPLEPPLADPAVETLQQFAARADG
jgi:hypothetical protein